MIPVNVMARVMGRRTHVKMAGSRWIEAIVVVVVVVVEVVVVCFGDKSLISSVEWYYCRLRRWSDVGIMLGEWGKWG